jgi:hypothetical protein
MSQTIEARRKALWFASDEPIPATAGPPVETFLLIEEAERPTIRVNAKWR